MLNLKKKNFGNTAGTKPQKAPDKMDGQTMPKMRANSFTSGAGATSAAMPP